MIIKKSRVCVLGEGSLKVVPEKARKYKIVIAYVN